MFLEFVQSLVANLSETMVYVAIAVVTLIGLCKCIYPLLRNAALLNRAVAKLEKCTASGERAMWREPRFLGRSLRNEWQEFLLNAGQLDIRGIPCNTKEYINDESVIDRPGHSQLSELIPGLLTSLGILGTFMGLMSGLTGISLDNAESTIQSIPELLAGMRFAFATSVAGISCSLLFNIFNRMAVGRANRALYNFEDAFYELAMPRPLQPEVQLLCQKQDDEERIARLAENVSNHIAASLEMALGRAMTPFTQSMDSFLRGATQEQVEGVRRIVGQFVQQMNTSLSSQITALGDTMNIVNQGQLQVQQNLQNTLATARATAQDAHTIQEASADIAHTMRAMSEQMRSEKESQLHSLEEAEQGGIALAKQLDALSISLVQMRKAIDTLTAELNGQPEHGAGASA